MLIFAPFNLSPIWSVDRNIVETPLSTYENVLGNNPEKLCVTLYCMSDDMRIEGNRSVL
jgi:hypothetical protein